MRAHLAESITDVARAAAQHGQRGRLYFVQTVGHRREAAEVAAEGAAHERQRGVVAVHERRAVEGIGAGVGRPRAAAQRQRLLRDRLALGEELGQPRRLQGAEPLDVVGGGVDQRQTRRRRPAAEPVEQPPQVDRAEEVLLEPQHDLVVIAGGFQRFRLLAGAARVALAVDGQALRQERHARFQGGDGVAVGADRALHQDVAPDDHVAGDAGPLEDPQSLVAVQDVQHRAAVTPWPPRAGG